MTIMKKNFLLLGTAAILFLLVMTGCKKYLDINSDPDTPQSPDASSVFPAMLGAIPRGLQFDARYASKYVQNFGAATTGTVNNMDRQGYNAGSDVNGDIWRQCYFGLGANLDYIIKNGSEKGQWDYVGAAQVLKAMMFQYATDYHGEIIFSEAFKENKAFFKYDDQEQIYEGIDSILRLGIYNLSRTDLNPTSVRLAKGDYVYSGNASRWIKFAWGLMARNAHRITNKSIYNADSVITFCNRALVDVSDDFLVPFDAAKNDDANFFGTYRDNLTSFRQSDFIVRLLDGTVLTGVTASSATAFNRDPRMKHLLTCSEDTTNGNGGYRGVAPATGDPNATLTLPTNSYAVGSANWINARKRISGMWTDSSFKEISFNANPSAAVFNPLYKHYLFADRCVLPIMSASEIQFIKAEAAFRKNDLTTALAAYTSGINLHFDFINRATFPRSNVTIFNGAPISAADRTAYLNGNNVKRTTGTLTLSDIMLQKYIALWGWGFFETFVDIRRYHWTDIDALTGQQVYRSMVLPAPLFADNLGKPVYRVRPRYNSEYVWNRDELLRIGGLNLDYHTYECWFSKP
ncbi:MAG TPA: SusD/RagB family nutrient-binding outer membrane lipoprotein [Chitinophagaceae bacterium]|nr:SusD/RagB family nutrient-binding outer membrane lipoprotein [Chitinophagaceae bacterium]